MLKPISIFLIYVKRLKEKLVKEIEEKLEQFSIPNSTFKIILEDEITIFCWIRWINNNITGITLIKENDLGSFKGYSCSSKVPLQTIKHISETLQKTNWKDYVTLYYADLC